MPRGVTPEAYLEAVPAVIRRAMLEDRDALEPGAAAVVGRFFGVVAARRESHRLPSAESFRRAAGSEPTFRTLLRALAKYAPHVSTANAVAVKREWLARRPKPKGAARATARTAVREKAPWPESWQRYGEALKKAPIRQKSLERYIASIDRCAALVATGVAGEELGFLTAYSLAKAFTEPADPAAAVKPVTAANYIHALIALGEQGGIHADALDGLRFVRAHLKRQASCGQKEKFGRIAEIMERGGFEYIAERIGEMRTEADALPAHAARAMHLRQSAALLAVLMNKPARTSDVAAWRIGEELTRAPDGTWRLAWCQDKTRHATEAGALWPEVSELLDAWILGGQPDRMIHLRYRELIGKNWMTLTGSAHAGKWPSARIKAAIGIPSHDLRTLAADYMRRHAPDRAAGIIATHLGHRTEEAGEEYRALCEGEAATQAWNRMRREIAATHGKELAPA